MFVILWRKLQVPDVWLVLINTSLTHMEVTSFEEIGFCLLRHAHVAQPRVGNPNIDDIPISKRDKKVLHRVPFGNDHDSRWLFGKFTSCLLFCMSRMFSLLGMGMFTLLTLMVVSCLWDIYEVTFGWYLIVFVLSLCLC